SRAGARTCARSRRAPRRRWRPRPRGRSRARREPRRPGTRAAAASSRPPLLGGRGSPPSAGRARSPSSKDDLGVGDVVLEREAGEALEGLDVAGAGLDDHFLRELRARRGLVPAEGLAVVPRVLLVEWRLGAARGIHVRGPEAGGVRRQGLVSENELAVLVE